jgi:hypothetical protein
MDSEITVDLLIGVFKGKVKVSQTTPSEPDMLQAVA